MKRLEKKETFMQSVFVFWPFASFGLNSMRGFLFGLIFATPVDKLAPPDYFLSLLLPALSVF